MKVQLFLGSAVVSFCVNLMSEIWCLQEKLHMENLKGSSRILGYIGSEWREVSSRLLPLASLKKTVQAMRLKVHSLEFNLV